MNGYLLSLSGGMLIGLSAVILMLANGRVAGISGIAGRLLQGLQSGVGAAFIIGLVFGPIVYRALSGSWPAVTVETGTPLLVVAGLLVGFGSRMGSGCTSGHGVVGLARLSPRSIAAVLTFLSTAVLTVFLMGILA
ncbi:YeeE/YedE family protein [Pararhizobium antarcticum]|uniref:Sulphur transport domain-containing protein n=1 Tax=Pararhizobium antarcticum TaxID=1798805 RepID=A0A657LPS1_9HYPH|nr:YeeE/YedE thiosulfate transporter family protein [Pararhizobium antarcticum]OJF93473.1 hypothetical protein AX760_05625 [Pararhizobium antarcticum]OJG00423.1 hypothetical protein AX761_08345 [Rhizobium sp. 58]